jgi:ADP-dependent NAD(P)H-hydrate dehydratase / NAD(P)H-hydrate epimerase
MRPLLSPAEMSAADRRTIDAGTGAEVLMDRAGRAVARAAIDLAGGRYGRRVAVVCGKGNNGGDGFVAARILQREGAGVACLLVGDANEARGAAAHHLENMLRAGVDAQPFDAAALARANVIVDALFGTGFRGVAEGEPAAAIHAINAARISARVVAVDIPSGVDGATGAVHGPAVKADVTVAMAAEKVGTAVGTGASLAGDVRVVGIGIDIPHTDLRVIDAGDVANSLPRRQPDAHKRSGGSVAILGGSAGMSGAVVLAARAAVRAGAGYATAGVTAAVERIVSVTVPEVLTTIASDGDVLGPDAIDKMKRVLDRANVLAVGPGLGTGPAQTELVQRVLREIELPVVIDADGLNVLAGRTRALCERSSPVIITPHPAELGRLLEMGTDEVQSDRIAAVRSAAETFRCVVVLKGFRSLIARAPDVVVNPTGGPELATAGTGDVLTGVVAALVGGGVQPFDAAWTGAFVHGLAGSIAARRFGVSGVLAGDVAEAVAPSVAEVRGQGWPASNGEVQPGRQSRERA